MGSVLLDLRQRSVVDVAAGYLSRLEFHKASDQVLYLWASIAIGLGVATLIVLGLLLIG
jgi:hypothetical protein